MLDIIAHGDIAELRLNRPPANALNHELLERLLNAYDEAIDGGARGLLLSGRDGMFCAGIDVVELLGQDRTSIHRFWSLLFRAARSLASSPVPVAAAVTGHSPAGGAVLAAHCDYRVAADDEFRIGFNEVRVGLPLPATILRVLAELVGPRVARQLGASGALISMQQAAEIGLVDELAPPNAVIARATEWLEGLLQLPPIAMNRTRLMAKSALLDALEDSRDVDRTTADWFTDETQTAMQALANNLKKD